MTKSQQRLADFVLQNMPEVAMMSSADLACCMDLSEATVVRFAQMLEFNGYPPDMRQQLQTELLKQFRSSSRVAAMVHAQSDNAGPLTMVVSETIKACSFSFKASMMHKLKKQCRE